MGNEHSSSGSLLLLKHMVRCHPWHNHLPTIRVQHPSHERFHRPTRRPEKDVVSLWLSLGGCPTWPSPVTSNRQPTALTAKHPRPLLGLTCSLDHLNRYPCSAEAPTTQGHRFQSSSTGTPKIPSRANHSRLSFWS